MPGIVLEESQPQGTSGCKDPGTLLLFYICNVLFFKLGGRYIFLLCFSLNYFCG